MSTDVLVQRLRGKLGLTQEEFAHRLAVTTSTVNRWERAGIKPSRLAMRAIVELAHREGHGDLVRHVRPSQFGLVLE